MPKRGSDFLGGTAPRRHGAGSLFFPLSLELHLDPIRPFSGGEDQPGGSTRKNCSRPHSEKGVASTLRDRYLNRGRCCEPLFGDLRRVDLTAGGGRTVDNQLTEVPTCYRIEGDGGASHALPYLAVREKLSPGINAQEIIDLDPCPRRHRPFHRLGNSGREPALNNQLLFTSIDIENDRVGGDTRHQQDDDCETRHGAPILPRNQSKMLPRMVQWIDSMTCVEGW